MPRTWTDEQFINAFNSSNSISEVFSKLGLKRAGATNHFLKHAKRLNLNIDDLYARRKLSKSENLIRNRKIAAPEEVLIKDSPFGTREAKLRIVRYNLLEYKCAGCELSTWKSSIKNNIEIPLVLDLDHINGINNDHRIENLRFLCPNCHSLTPTYKAKNKRNGNTSSTKHQ